MPLFGFFFKPLTNQVIFPPFKARTKPQPFPYPSREGQANASSLPFKGRARVGMGLEIWIIPLSFLPYTGLPCLKSSRGHRHECRKAHRRASRPEMRADHFFEARLPNKESKHSGRTPSRGPPARPPVARRIVKRNHSDPLLP